MRARDLGDGYTPAAKRQGNQGLGTGTALFDCAAQAIKSATDAKDKTALAAAIGKLSVDTPIGKVDFTKGPFPNVNKTADFRSMAGRNP